MSLSIGLGFNFKIGTARWTIRVLGAGVFLFYSVLPAPQLRGMQLPIGAPFFIPIVIGLGFIAGYLVDRGGKSSWELRYLKAWPSN